MELDQELATIPRQSPKLKELGYICHIYISQDYERHNLIDKAEDLQLESYRNGISS